MRITRSFATILAALAVLVTGSGCGGGDSGSSASPAVAPTITVQPSSITVLEEDTARFEVIATGTQPLTYQWLKDGVPISGATSAVYVTPSVARRHDEGDYSVRVANSAGSVTSTEARLRINPRPPELSLLAGSSDGAGYLNGPISAARFATPYALAFDTSGNAYVSDGGNYVIRQVNTTGTVSTFAGAAGLPGQQDGRQEDARFSFPRGLIVDALGTVYVADYGGNTVRRISAGVVMTLAGSATPGSADGTGVLASFNAPSGVALDGQDALVTDSSNHTIRRITPTGVVTTVVGQAGTPGTLDGVGTAGLLTSPWAIAPAGAGRFIILERSSPARLRLLQGATLTTLTTFPTAVVSPEGLAVDPSGNAYVAATFSHVIYRWDQATGLTSVVAGTVGTSGALNGIGTQARFFRPRGLAFRNADELLIADTGNRAVRSLRLSTQSVTTFAGSLRNAGFVDGNGTGVRFSSPLAIRENFLGDYFLVLDFDNGAIRRFRVDGGVSTGHVGTPGFIGLVSPSAGSVLIARPETSVIEHISPAGVVSIFAGVPNQRGSTDGPAAMALFDEPRALTLDGMGGVFVADGNGTLRHISSAGIVSTYAGVAGQKLVVDGPRAQARFQDPGEMVWDGICRNLYVLDGHSVRKINQDGIVSTFAGNASEPGYVDRRGAMARFNSPRALSVDSTHYVYVADYFNHVIRKISPTGFVSTVVGSGGIGSFQPGIPPHRIAFPSGVLISGTTLYFTHEDGLSRVRNVFFPESIISDCVR